MYQKSCLSPLALILVLLFPTFATAESPWQRDRWSDVPQRNYRDQQREREEENTSEVPEERTYPLEESYPTDNAYRPEVVENPERFSQPAAQSNTSAFTSRADGYESTYLLGSGDKLSINVFGEEDLSVKEVRLNDSGSISYPFLGEITAAGRTVGQLEDVIRAGLQNGYLMDPKVNVTILEYREFYIYGEVEEPGSYPFQPGLTIRKAVAIAGGFTERASESKIFIIPERAPPGTEPRNVSVGGLVSPGDTITIKQRFF